MLTFIHLSDIHFTDRDAGTQFDRDKRVRSALLDDLESKPALRASYDGILITGDIAFSGKKEQYDLAQTWLDEVFSRSGAAMADTYMVPGNHDVDRTFIAPGLASWSAHLEIRGSKDSEVWHNLIKTQAISDPLHTLLAPLGKYNDFAQGYECRTTGGDLAWVKVFRKPLNDGTYIRLHGLNSALISDAADTQGGLLLTQFQTSHLENSASMVNLVLCHHPPDWLMDKHDIGNTLKDFAPVALFGHEHTTHLSLDRRFVRLFSGAVHPTRRDLNRWVPTYHILQLSIDNRAERSLVVRIHTREYSEDRGHRFHPRLTDDDEPFEEHRIPIPVSRPANEPMAITSTFQPIAPEVSSTIMPSATEPSIPTPKEIATRELLVHFFRLGTPLRYSAATEAGLLRDGDDSLQPQAMWIEVFHRASQEGKLRNFWEAVASRNPALTKESNPFT